jgi:hypothetical protein
MVDRIEEIDDLDSELINYVVATNEDDDPSDSVNRH